MARVSTITKRKPKKPSLSVSEARVVNSKAFGSEPAFKAGHLLSRIELMNTINWYHYMENEADAREYITAWLKKHDTKENLAKFRRVPEKFIPTVLGWMARLLERGYKLPEPENTSFRTKLKALLATSFKVVEEDEKTEGETGIIQKRMKEKAHDLLAHLESEIDAKNYEFSTYEYLKAGAYPKLYGPKIVAYYEPLLAELNEALKGKDPDLKEGYRNFTKAELTKFRDFVASMVSDAKRYSDNVKATRAPRKKKPMSAEKKMKSFKYQKEFMELRLVSVEPSQILGANEVWLFNSRYNTLSKLVTSSRTGFDVKGTTIINIDVNESKSRRIGRQAEKFTSQVLTLPKTKLAKLFDEIKSGDLDINGRVNENTIILKVVK